MNIAIVEMDSTRRVHIFRSFAMPRGATLLAALLKQRGHRVTSFIESLQGFKMEVLMGFDAVCFSIISCTALPSYAMIRALRAAGYEGKIVTGGPHANALTEESLDAGADAVVHHEGDITFPLMIEAFERNLDWTKMLGISWKDSNGKVITNPDRNLLTSKQLSALPFPDFKSAPGWQRMRVVPIATCRGCPFRCTYCGVEPMFGHGCRPISVEAMLGQLDTVRDEYPFFWKKRSMFFTSDNFIGNAEGKAIATRFMEEMISTKRIPPKGWSGQIRITDALDIETCRLMKRAGCNLVYVGIETLDPDTLKDIHKGQTAKQIKIGLANLRACGIKVHAMLIAGMDGMSFWKFYRMVRLLTKWGIYTLQVLGITPLPGTELTLKWIAEGRKISYNYNDYDGMGPTVESEGVSRFGVWACIYLVPIRFYFSTFHGLGLILRNLPSVAWMTVMGFGQLTTTLFASLRKSRQV